ncbi:MAG TPA: transketolase [Methylomirabilota bacterium]|jgi:transketolase|nr:transketolase [Methylomirabilota bacterium]
MAAAQQVVPGLEDRATRLRIHSIRATTAAGSGHPTSCCSAADLVAALFFDVMRFRPTEPTAVENDRLILSKGHAAPLLYAAWAEAGALSSDELLTLRRVDSDLEGHPTPRLPFVEAATGSLGQGLSIGAGMAVGRKLDKLPGAIFVILGDGECAEGNVWEAAAFAGYYRLENLIAVVDVNRLGQSQPTMLEHNCRVYAERFRAFGWRSILVDGHDMGQVVKVLRRARRPSGVPVAVIARTIKGKGIPGIEDLEGWHGKPLDEDGANKAVAALEAQLHGVELPRVRPPRGVTRSAAPAALATDPFTVSAHAKASAVATRQAYGEALAKLGKINPAVVALDGDVKNSTYAERFKEACPERYVEGFIAEQNMAAAAVGLAAGGKIPFVSTFACFLTRAFDQIRMAAISRANVKFSGSHCGVSIGEDGPSQMGLEDLAMFRAVPGSVILYPSDAVSAERCVELAASTRGIVYIRTTRPKTSVLYGPDERFAVGGLKVLRQSERDRVTVVGAGVTLHEALAAWEQLNGQGIPIRVIDLYSVKPLDRAGLLGAAQATNRRLITVEDHYPQGGLGDAVLEALAGESIRVHKLAVSELPRSGKPDALLDRYGISARHIVDTVRHLATE